MNTIRRTIIACAIMLLITVAWSFFGECRAADAIQIPSALPTRLATIEESVGTNGCFAYADGSISNADLAADACDSDQYVDGSVDLVHMAADSVDGTKIVDGSVSNADLSADACDSDQYVDGSVDLVHMAADSVDGTKIVDGSVSNADLSADACDSDQYVDGSVDLVHMAADSVDGTKIVDGSVSNADLSADCIDGTKLDDDACDSEHYTDGSIDQEHYADDMVFSPLGADLYVTGWTNTLSGGTHTHAFTTAFSAAPYAVVVQYAEDPGVGTNRIYAAQASWATNQCVVTGDSDKLYTGVAVGPR